MYTISIQNINPTTIFSRIPFLGTEESEKKDIEKTKEDRKLSYWLEKLHIQGEQIRTDNNRREEQSKNLIPKESFSNPDPHPHFHSHRKDDTLFESGINLHKRNKATKNEEDRQAVNDLVRKSNRLVISISSTFPWDLFPNTIDVEESRVTFKFSQFLSSQSHSVDIRDISNVFIESSVFFSTLQVVSRTFVQNDIKIGKLNKAKARKVQRVIEGLRTFIENDINTSNYELSELIAKIEEFHKRPDIIKSI